MFNMNFIKKTGAFILAAAMLVSSSAMSVNAEEYVKHKVSSGETLSGIASEYGVSVDDIILLNNIDNRNYISVNMELLIPAAAGLETQAETSAETQTAIPAATSAGTFDTSLEKVSYTTLISTMDTKISVNFKDTDVRDVLSSFALNMGYNFIFKGSPTEITLNLKDVTISEALDYVMKLIDMTYITDGKTIIVGEKSDLISTFNENLQLTEFSLTYVTAAAMISQINTLKIDVTATQVGANEFKFIAKGLPSDLSKVRDLITMIDKRENSMLGTVAVASTFYAVELTYLSANDFSSVLSAVSLPAGVVLAGKPKVLYVYCTPNDYKSILSIKTVVDTEDPVVTPESVIIKRIDFRYVTLDLIESQITANSEVDIIKISTNKSTVWLKGTSAQISNAEEIINLLDIESNALATNETIKNQFRPITLRYINAATFNATLANLSLPTGISFAQNPQTLYVFTTQENFEAIAEIQAIVDNADNSTLNADANIKMEKINLINTDKEVAIPFINALGLDVQVISISNMQKALWIKGTAENISEVRNALNQIDMYDSNINNSFRKFYLSNITADEMAKKIETLNLTGINVYTNLFPQYSQTILISYPNDMESTITGLIVSLDSSSELVNLPIDSSTDADGMNKLSNRIPYISLMSGIASSKFAVSENVSKGEGVLYVLYLVNATQAEVQKARDVVSELG